MLARLTAGLSGMAGVLLISATSHAACTKDTDCKGDRVCEEGACVDPPANLPPPPPPPAGGGTPAAVAPPPTAAQPAPAPQTSAVRPTVDGKARQDDYLY